jgi:uncharacterized protein (TIGR03083 family)
MMREERHDIRRLLGELTPQQWRADSLCVGWSVRDLVAHLVAWDEVLLYRSRRGHIHALLRFSVLYGGSLASMRLINRRLQRRTRRLDPVALANRFGRDDGEDLKWLFDATNPGAHLAEYVIHQQDIRLPLGMPEPVSPDRLLAALHGVTHLPGVRAHVRWRLCRERLEATNVEWARGRGQLQRMTGEAILLRLAGRPVQQAST